MEFNPKFNPRYLLNHYLANYLAKLNIQSQAKIILLSLGLILAFIMSFFIASLIEYFFLPVKTNKVQNIITDRDIGDQTRPFGRYQNIIKNQLFYTKSSTTNKQQKVVQQEKALPTLDTIILSGVSIWPTVRFALIVNKTDKKEKLFRLNEMIFDTQAELIQISFDHIVLLQNGERKTVYIKRESFDHKQLGRSQVASNKVSSITKQQNRVQREKDQNNPFQDIKTEYNLKRKEVNNIINNLDTVIKQARAVPKLNKTGKIEGYIIRNIVPGSFFQKVGLKNEDIVIAVNGNKLNSFQQGLRLFDLVKSETFFNVELIRKNTPLNLNYFVN